MKTFKDLKAGDIVYQIEAVTENDINVRTHIVKKLKHSTHLYTTQALDIIFSPSNKLSLWIPEDEKSVYMHYFRDDVGFTVYATDPSEIKKWFENFSNSFLKELEKLNDPS